MATARIPVPPPIPTALLPQTAAEPPQSRRVEVPSWATSFAVHCIFIILLGLYSLKDSMVGNHGLTDVTLSWQESSGDDQLDMDSGAKLGAEEISIEVATETTTEVNAEVLEQFADMFAQPSELQLELPDAKKGGKSVDELAGLLGGGTGTSGEGMSSGKGIGVGKTQFFGIETEGRSFLYVFDRSYSMNSYEQVPLIAAKEELLSSVSHLSEQQQFYIVFYNHEPQLYDPSGSSRGRLQFATPANKDRLKRFLYRLDADGGTRHITALEVAVRMKPDVIYLLTDAEEKDDLTDGEMQGITRLNSGGASIHVVHFALDSRPNSSIAQLAKRNRGQYRFIDVRRLAQRLAGLIPQ